MTSAVVVYENADQVRKDLAGMESAISGVLPTGMTPERFVRVVVKAIIGNPKLMQCTRTSILTAVHDAAELGLEPTGMLGSAYLVPYRRKYKVAGRDEYRMEAQLIPGYRGLIDLARRSGEIDGIEAEVVNARDVFRLIKGSNGMIVHEPFIPDPTDKPEDRDPGPIIGAYMLATLRGGHEQREWMTFDQIEAVRKNSRAADQGPWVENYSEMARKTVVRRGSKYLPLTTQFRRALELDDEAEREAVAPEAAPALSMAARLALSRGSDPVQETQEQQGSGDTTEGRNESSAATQAASGDGLCPVISPELGRCARKPHKTGAHKNDAGVWPQGGEG